MECEGGSKRVITDKRTGQAVEVDIFGDKPDFVCYF